MQDKYHFLGQILLPDNLFSSMGVDHFPIKLQFWQKRYNVEGWKAHPYYILPTYILQENYSIQKEAQRAYEHFIRYAKANLEQNSMRVLLELGKGHNSSKDFPYQVQKLLYQTA